MMKRIAAILLTWVVLLPLFAQGYHPDNNPRIPLFTPVESSLYEHVMFLTCVLYEGDVRIDDFEVGVFDAEGVCRGEAISDLQQHSIGFVTIHGRSGEKGMTVKVVYGPATAPQMVTIEGFSLDFADLDNIGTTREPYVLHLPLEATFRCTTPDGVRQQHTLQQVQQGAASLAGVSGIELLGQWTADDLRQVNALLPKSTLHEVTFSSDFAHLPLSHLLAGCVSLTAVHFRAVPQGAVDGFLEGANPNAILYFPSGSQEQQVPAGWTNVACSTGTDAITGEPTYAALTDFLFQGSTPTSIHPFACAHDIRLGAHTATYEPAQLQFVEYAPAWNALVLPFDAVVYADGTQLYENTWNYPEPDAYWLMGYTGYRGQQLLFSYTRSGLKAHIPYLLAFAGDALGSQYSQRGRRITFRSVDTHIHAVPARVVDPYFTQRPTDVEFIGTYQALHTSAFVLSPLASGGPDCVFVPQGQVLPFGAYMSPVKPLGIGQLPIPDSYVTTTVPTLQIKEKSAKKLFDLSGRSFTDESHVPSGLYILGGEKRWKR